MTLEKWIKKRGVVKTAQDLGTSRINVYYWCNGRCLPNAVRMRDIVKLSKGRVSYKKMIEEHIEMKNKRGK